MLGKTILAPSSTNPTGGWLYLTMTTSSDAPAGDPPWSHDQKPHCLASDVGRQKIESREAFLQKSMTRDQLSKEDEKTPTTPKAANHRRPPTQDQVIHVEIDHDRSKIDRSTAFRSKTTAKMKDLVFT